MSEKEKNVWNFGTIIVIFAAFLFQGKTEFIVNSPCPGFRLKILDSRETNIDMRLHLFIVPAASWRNAWPEVMILFSCSTQLSMTFQLLIKTSFLKIKDLAFKLSGSVVIMLINVKLLAF